MISREEWLEWRRGGLGGSDVAGVLGVSPWATPFSVWWSKVHEARATGNPSWEESYEKARKLLADEGAAVDIAEQYGVTLCGFVRDGRFNIYTHVDRVC